MIQRWLFAMQILAVILSLVAAYQSFVIYRYNRLARPWLAVTAAFILIIVRRAVAFFREFDLVPIEAQTSQLLEAVLLLVISALYVWGFWEMQKRFQTFEIIDREAGEKVKAFWELRPLPARQRRTKRRGR